MERLLQLSTILAAVGSAVVGGLLFAFSTSVMPALSRQPNSSAAATMQSVNTVIQNPLFLALFVGTSLSCVGVLVLSPIVGGPGTVVAVIAASMFVVGTFVVTMVVNVPLNDRLAALDPEAAQLFWQEYLTRWTRWNHIRAAAAVVASCLMITRSVLV